MEVPPPSTSLPTSPPTPGPCLSPLSMVLMLSDSSSVLWEGNSSVAGLKSPARGFCFFLGSQLTQGSWSIGFACRGIGDRATTRDILDSLHPQLGPLLQGPSSSHGNMLRRPVSSGEGSGCVPLPPIPSASCRSVSFIQCSSPSHDAFIGILVSSNDNSNPQLSSQ